LHWLAGGNSNILHQPTVTWHGDLSLEVERFIGDIRSIGTFSTCVRNHNKRNLPRYWIRKIFVSSLLWHFNCIRWYGPYVRPWNNWGWAHYLEPELGIRRPHHSNFITPRKKDSMIVIPEIVFIEFECMQRSAWSESRQHLTSDLLYPQLLPMTIYVNNTPSKSHLAER